MKNHKLIYSLILLLLLSISFKTYAYDRISLMPQDVNFVLRLSNTREFGKSLEQCPLGRLWVDEEFQRFFGNVNLIETVKNSFIKSFKEKGEHGEEKGLLLWQQLKLLKGEAILAIKLSKDPSAEASIFFAGAMSAEEYRKNIDIDKQVVELEAETSKFNTYDFQGVEVFQLTTEKDGKVKHEWQAWVNGTLIGAENRQWLEKAILVLIKQTPDEPNEAPSLTFTISSGTIEDGLSNMSGPSSYDSRKNRDEEAKAKERSGKVLKSLGMEDLKDIKLSLTANKKSIKITGEINDISSREGIWTLFDIKPISGNTRLPYLPASTYSYQEMKFNINKFWRQIPEMLMQINPPLGMQFQGALLIVQGFAGIDLYNGFISILDSTYISYSCIETGVTRKAYALGLQDDKKMEMTLEKLLSPGGAINTRMGKALKIDNYLGHRLYLIKIDPTTEEKTGLTLKYKPDATNIGITVVDGMLMFGEPSLLRATIQAVNSGGGDEFSFYRSPKYKRMIKKVPENVYEFTITDSAAFCKSLITLLKQKQFSNMLDNNLGSSDNEAEDKSLFEELFSSIDYNKLPDAKHLAEFFDITVDYLQLKDNKLTASFEIYAPEKK